MRDNLPTVIGTVAVMVMVVVMSGLGGEGKKAHD
jgi:hypothetical protein